MELLKNEKFCSKFNLAKGIKGKTIIVQGLGNVGYWATKYCEEGGAKIIGIVEWNSAIYNPDGIVVDEAFNYFRTNKSFKDYPKAKEIKGATDYMDIMYKECDILIPAAIENSITK